VVSTEEVSLLHEGVGSFGETVREVGPDDGAGHVEEELRQSVRGELGNVAEDDGEGDCREERLDEVPERSEDSLFVDGDEVTANEEEDEVTIAVEVAEVKVEESAFWFDDEVPGVRLMGGHR